MTWLILLIVVSVCLIASPIFATPHTIMSYGPLVWAGIFGLVVSLGWCLVLLVKGLL